MFITLETDYAVRIVHCLAVRKVRTSAADISEQTRVPQRFALKILRKLVSGGIVKSYKGVNGGYTLMRDPSEITLRRVVEVMEGPIILSRCLSEDYVCTGYDGCACYFSERFYEISKKLAETLEEVKFSDALPKEDK